MLDFSYNNYIRSNLFFSTGICKRSNLMFMKKSNGSKMQIPLPLKPFFTFQESMHCNIVVVSFYMRRKAFIDRPTSVAFFRLVKQCHIISSLKSERHLNADRPLRVERVRVTSSIWRESVFVRSRETRDQTSYTL